MAQERRRTRSTIVTPGIEEQAKADAEIRRSGDIWIREDGAFCVGDECLVFERKPDRLEVTVNPGKCGDPGPELLKQLVETIGMGMPTHYVVKSSLEDPK